MTRKKQTAFRLTGTAQELLRRMAEKLGIDKTAVTELAIRAYAKSQDVPISTKGNETK